MNPRHRLPTIFHDAKLKQISFVGSWLVCFCTQRRRFRPLNVRLGSVTRHEQKSSIFTQRGVGRRSFFLSTFVVGTAHDNSDRLQALDCELLDSPYGSAGVVFCYHHKSTLR